MTAKLEFKLKLFPWFMLIVSKCWRLLCLLGSLFIIAYWLLGGLLATSLFIFATGSKSYFRSLPDYINHIMTLLHMLCTYIFLIYLQVSFTFLKITFYFTQTIITSPERLFRHLLLSIFHIKQFSLRA